MKSRFQIVFSVAFLAIFAFNSLALAQRKAPAPSAAPPKPVEARKPTVINLPPPPPQKPAPTPAPVVQERKPTVINLPQATPAPVVKATATPPPVQYGNQAVKATPTPAAPVATPSVQYGNQAAKPSPTMQATQQNATGVQYGNKQATVIPLAKLSPTELAKREAQAKQSGKYFADRNSAIAAIKAKEPIQTTFATEPAERPYWAPEQDDRGRQVVFSNGRYRSYDGSRYYDYDPYADSYGQSRIFNHGGYYAPGVVYYNDPTPGYNYANQPAVAYPQQPTQPGQRMGFFGAFATVAVFAMILAAACFIAYLYFRSKRRTNP